MKKTNILKTVVLALASLSLMASNSRAAALSYNAGDLFLGFHATGGTGAALDYLVNIGQASQYRDATSPFTLSISGIDADLTATFGAWETRSDLYWGVFGTTYASTVGSDGPATNYASKPESTFGTQATAYIRPQAAQGELTAGYIDSMATTFATQSSTGNNTVGTVQTVGDVNSNSYGSKQNGSSKSFGTYTNAVGSFANGTSGAALDLFRITTRVAANQPSSYEGTFQINDSGTVTFSNVTPSAVPEPSTYGLVFGAGALLLVFIRRRNALKA